MKHICYKCFKRKGIFFGICLKCAEKYGFVGKIRTVKKKIFPDYIQ